MLLYNKIWIDHLEVLKAAEKWLNRNLIAAAEHSAIAGKYATPYHESNVFARIGMFLFGLVCVLASAGLYNLMFMSSSFLAIVFQCFFLGALYYGATELMIREKHFYHSGVTDALLYASTFCVCMGIILGINGSDFNFSVDPIVDILCVMPVLCFLAIRFADAFLSLLSFAAVIAVNVLLVLKLETTGQLILPFESMLISWLVYALVKKHSGKNNLRFWKQCLLTIETASLALLYLSGNYLVVRQLSEMLLGVSVPPGGDIAFAPFFYAYTIVVPLAYIVLGLKRKDRPMIWLGILLEASGILCIRYYHSLLPLETALILAGAFLVLLSWVAIRYLRTPKHGIAYDEVPEDAEAMDALSSILISRAAARAVPGNENPFGGGESGGGGAGGKY